VTHAHDATPRDAGARPLRRYAYAGVVVSSALPLPELPAADESGGPQPFVTVRAAATPCAEPADGDWLHHWRGDDGSTVLSLAVVPCGRLLRFPGLADFELSADDAQLAVRPAVETEPHTVRHLLVDQVLPRLLAHRGRFVLHASAVRMGGEAVAFLGPAGRGKSTLAASFHEAGCGLLCDDGLVLAAGANGVEAVPTYGGLRLMPDAIDTLFGPAAGSAPMAQYSSKRRMRPGETADRAPERLRLAALFLLAPEPGAEAGVEADAQAGGVSSRRLSPREACIAMLDQSFQLDVTDAARAARHFALAGDLALLVPAFELTYPREFSRLREVQAAVLRPRV
jgi:hypothetical protein